MVMLSKMSLPMHLNHLADLLFYDKWLIVIMPVIRRIDNLVPDMLSGSINRLLGGFLNNSPQSSLLFLALDLLR